MNELHQRIELLKRRFRADKGIEPTHVFLSDEDQVAAAPTFPPGDPVVCGLKLVDTNGLEETSVGVL